MRNRWCSSRRSCKWKEQCSQIWILPPSIHLQIWIITSEVFLVLYMLRHLTSYQGRPIPHGSGGKLLHRLFSLWTLWGLSAKEQNKITVDFVMKPFLICLAYGSIQKPEICTWSCTSLKEAPALERLITYYKNMEKRGMFLFHGWGVEVLKQ